MSPIRDLQLQVELEGGPAGSCDWGECDRESVGWALDCLGSCGEPDHRVPAGAIARWLPVCRAAAIVATETGHRVILLGEVLESMNLDDEGLVWREAVVRDEGQLRADLEPLRTAA